MIVRLKSDWVYEGKKESKGNLVYGKAAVKAMKDGFGKVVKGSMPDETKAKPKAGK